MTVSAGPEKFGLYPFSGAFTADEFRSFFAWCSAQGVSDVDLVGGSPVFSSAGITAHQVSTILVLFAGAGVSWSRALIITYRLWQLRSRRVSLAEGGTFRHFLTETRAVRNAIRGR